MTQLLDILEDYMELRGFRYARLDGSMAYTDREEEVSTTQLWRFVCGSKKSKVDLEVAVTACVSVSYK